jgi:spore maturation protein CgeB
MSEVFTNSKINLNISNSVCYDIRYIFADPRNLIHTFLHPKNASQVKARNFEINYSGGFQLTDFVPGIEEYYEIGKEIACYSSPKEAVMLINYYLRHDDERELIREKGCIKARNNFTYKSRFETIIKQIN